MKGLDWWLNVNENRIHKCIGWTALETEHCQYKYIAPSGHIWYTCWEVYIISYKLYKNDSSYYYGKFDEKLIPLLEVYGE